MRGSAAAVEISLAQRYTPAAELLRALASPIRVTLIVELGHGPRCVHELITTSGASQSLVSQHLRVLRAARVVRAERRGREVVYTLSDTHVAHIVDDAITHAEEAS